MKEKYDKNGYIILENFFSQEKLDLVKNQLHSLIEHELVKAGIVEEEWSCENVLCSCIRGAIHIRPLRPEKRPVSDTLNEGLIVLDQKDHSIVQHIYDTFSRSDDLLNMVFDTKLCDIIKELLVLTEDQALHNLYHVGRIDPPNDNRFTYGWHQQSYYSIAESNQVQLWTPLVNRNTKEMGTISILLDSHKKEIQHHIDQVPDGHKQMILKDEEVTHFEEKIIELNPTDILLFHPLMIHRSNNNVSKKVRYSLVSTFVNPYDPRFRRMTKQEKRDYHESRCKTT